MNILPAKRYLHFDIMNILACMGVVIMHHNTHLNSFDNSARWTFSLALECLLYWNVPVFIMISGANLLGYREKYDTKTFFKKRIVRTLIPWLIWSVFILLWKGMTGQICSNELTYSDYIRMILTNNADATYWFFTNIFGCYLLTPILTYLTPHKNALWSTVIGIFVLSFIEPIVPVLLPLSHAGVVALENSLIIYYILGYLLNNTEFTKNQRIPIYVAGICAIIFRFCYTYFGAVTGNAASMTARGNKMCNTIICATAVFIFLRNIDWEKKIPDFIKRVFPKLASCSLGVYLLHKVIIYHLREYSGLPVQSFVWKLFFPFVTYLISITVIFLLKKIPVINKFIC